MAEFVMLVFGNSMPGRDSEFNDWYNTVHLQEVLTVDGFVAARRFTRSDDTGDHRYLTIYEIEAESAEEAMARLIAAAPQMDISETLDRQNVLYSIYEAAGPRVGNDRR